jgi:hypothetical protein
LSFILENEEKGKVLQKRSSNLPQEREINKSAFYALFFCYAKKDVRRENLSGRRCFFGKNQRFLPKKQRRPLKITPRTPFERSEKQCVSNHAFIYFTFFRVE